MASGMDIWGAIASAIGVLSTIQIILTIINGRLPSKCICLFERTLKDTEELLNSVSEEGLFNDNGRYVTHAKTRISNICKRLEDLREESFEAKTYRQELKQWWWGLSGRITVCNDELKELRAEISVTSSKARSALAQQCQDVHRNGMATVTLGGEYGRVPASELVLGEGSCDSGSADGSPSMGACPDGTTPPGQPEQECSIRADECEGYVGVVEASTDGSCKVGDTKPVHCCLHGSPQSPTRSHSTDTLPPYRRQSIPPSYPPCSTPVCSDDFIFTWETPVTRTTSLLSRCTAGDSPRTKRMLIKAYRQNLMVHNVPWNPRGSQHPHRGTSAAASARAVDRPSNNTRHWKLLEERTKVPLRSYIAVLSHEAISDTSRHATGTGRAGGTVLSPFSDRPAASGDC